MAPYNSVLKVDEYKPRDQVADYKEFLQMKSDTEGDRAALAGQKMETLQGLLDKIPGFSDLYGKTTNLIGSMLEGKLSDPMKQILGQQGAALSAQHGVGGSQAGANIGLASLGREAVATQQRGLMQVPQILNSLKMSFMGNILSSPDVEGPSYAGWASQQQADTRDVYESKQAQNKALHQVQQLNEQYAVQEAARAAAQTRMDASVNAQRSHDIKIMGSQQRLQMHMSNQSNIAQVQGNSSMGGVSNPFAGRHRPGSMMKPRNYG